MKKLHIILITALALPPLLSLSQSETDGRYWLHYTVADGLSQSYISIIYQDSRGHILVGNQMAVNLFTGREFLPLGMNNWDDAGYVKSIIEDPNNPDKLIIATTNDCKELSFPDFQAKNRKFTVISTETPNKIDTIKQITAICRDGKNLWIGTKNGLIDLESGMRYFQNSNIISVQKSDSLLYIVTDSTDKKEGTLNVMVNKDKPTAWYEDVSVVNCNGRLIYAKKDKLYIEGEASVTLKSNITAIYSDSRGRIWVGTDSDGLFVRLSSQQTFEKVKITSNHVINCISESAEGAIWVGTNEGIYQYFHRQVFYTPQASEMHANIFSILPDRNDKHTYWLGLRNQLVMKYDDQNKSIIKNIPGINVSETRTLIYAGNIILAGTTSGIYSISREKGGGSFSKKLPLMLQNKEPCKNQDTRCLMFDERLNTIWISTTSEVLIGEIRNDTIWVIPVKIGPKSQSTSGMAFCMDDKWNLFIGTDNGLYRIERQSFQESGRFSFNNKNLLNKNIWVECILSDDDILWVGSKGEGLIKLKRMPDGNIIPIKFYKKEDGLKDPTVYSMAKDAFGNLWLGTNRGLFRFNPKDESFAWFTKEDGLQNDEFNANSICIADSTIWIGGISWISSFLPLTQRNNIVNNKIELFQKTESGSSIQFFSNGLNNIVLGDSRSDPGLSVLYASYLSYEDPKRNTFDFIFIRNNLFFGSDTLVIQKNVTEFALPPLDFISEYRLVVSLHDKTLYAYNESSAPTQEFIIKQKILNFYAFLIATALISFFLILYLLYLGSRNKQKSITSEKFKKIFEFLHDIAIETRVATTRASFQELLVRVLTLSSEDRLKTLLNADVFSVSLKVKEQDILEDYVAIEDKQSLLNPDSNDKIIYPLSNVKYKAVDCYVNNKVIFINDLDKEISSSDRPEPIKGRKVRSMIYVPIYEDEKETIIIGVATIQSFTPNAFEKDFHVSFLKSLGALVATSIFGQIDKIDKEKIMVQYKIRAPQIALHFVGNAFGALENLVYGPALALTKNVKALCRAWLDGMRDDKKGIVSIEDEINFLGQYIDVMKVRYGIEELSWIVSVDQLIDTEKDMLPSLFLQPYVENAIIHGLVPQYNISKKYNGKIELLFELEDNYLSIMIKDNGAGFRENNGHNLNGHRSYSLNINKERAESLNHLYPGAYLAMLINGPINNSTKGTIVTIKIRTDLLRTEYNGNTNNI